MKKVLITGGYGMVGSAMESQIKLSRETCDLTNPRQTNKLFKLIKPDGVIHCAGKVGGIGGNSNYKGEYFYNNLMINTNVIEAARKAGVKNLVAFLSTCVFPDKVKYPLTVDQIQLGEPHESNYPYAYAKRMADVQIRAYREQYGINYTSIIPSNIYGPNDNFNLSDAHVIPSLIHKGYISSNEDEPFVVCGTGKPLRQFIYSQDLAKIIMLILENYNEKESIIISPDENEEVSIKEVAEIIANKYDIKKKLAFDISYSDGQFKKTADNKKLKNLLPNNFKFKNIKEGIEDSIDWFIDNYEEARI